MPELVSDSDSSEDSDPTGERVEHLSLGQGYRISRVLKNKKKKKPPGVKKRKKKDVKERV